MLILLNMTYSEVDVGQLFKMVARNAILNAGGRADEVGCFPGTREEVIDKVEKWMGRVENGSCKNRIMWLSGPAGAGKSAICQTIAECCPTRGQQAANFFFFRGDLTRNRAQPLVPTLVYQLRRFYPMLDGLLANCLIADPLICEASIEDQFLHLISSPMEAVHQSSSAHESIVLIIDGLDECDDSRKQDQIIIALRALVNADHSPFLVLIASRTEPHLIMSFNRLGTSVESIFLGDEYRPGDDIRRFVVAKFEEIKQVHHLRQMLSENWPAESDIDAITDKSSGQFIYAATVMRFILHSPESPSLSLVVILEMKTPAGHNPLAQLDAVYTYIFSKVHDIQQVKIILGAFFTIGMKVQCKTTDYQNFLQFIGYGPVEVKSLFSYLGAIIQIHTNPLKLVFYHASLHDYLRSKYRSLDYYLDIGDIATRISIISLKNFDHKRASRYSFMLFQNAHCFQVHLILLLCLLSS